MAHKAVAPTQRNTAAIFYLTGAASLFVCFAWLLQTTTFTGGDAKVATVLWTLMAAGVAGSGSALIYVAKYWLAR